MIFAPLLTLMGKRELVAFLKPAFLMSCDSQCCVALPQCAVGWSAVCDCCISCSHSLVFLVHFSGTLDTHISEILHWVRNSYPCYLTK